MLFSCDMTLWAECGNSCQTSWPARLWRSQRLAAIWGVWNGAWSEHSRAARGRPHRSANSDQIDIWSDPMLLSSLTPPTGGGGGWGRWGDSVWWQLRPLWTVSHRLTREGLQRIWGWRDEGGRQGSRGRRGWRKKWGETGSQRLVFQEVNWSFEMTH